MKNVIKLLKVQASSVTSSADMKAPQGSADVGRKPTLQRCATLLKAFFDLESQIDSVPLTAMTGGAKCAVLPGEWLITALHKIGINPFTVNRHLF